MAEKDVVGNLVACLDHDLQYVRLDDKVDESPQWTEEYSAQLQKAVDNIFEKNKGKKDQQLTSLKFSFTIADPLIECCPLVGCSTGFEELCGYEMREIVGRNCRFLVDPVPQDMLNHNVRHFAREFCRAVAEGRDYRIPDKDKEPWMPKGRHSDDGIFCIQTNARKDGRLFDNMFYLKKIELNEHPYIIGLQTEVSQGNTQHIEDCHAACRLLDDNMSEVERHLARKFWISTAMRRQEHKDANFHRMVSEGNAQAYMRETAGPRPVPCT